jgi:C_GCAxxG_C_C family probable redox protein
MEVDRKEEMNRLEKKADNFEKKYGVCSQAVLYAFKEEYNIISDEVFKAGNGLAGGIGLLGSDCGALSAGAMVIGVVNGRSFNNLEDSGKKNSFSTLKMVKELAEKFTQEYKAFNCYSIQEKIMGKSYNLWNSKELENFLKDGGHGDKCPVVCGKVARWTAEILINNKLL